LVYSFCRKIVNDYLICDYSKPKNLEKIKIVAVVYGYGGAICGFEV